MQFQFKKRLSIMVGILLPIAALVGVVVWRYAAGEPKEAGRNVSEVAIASAAPEAVLDSIELTPRVIKMGGIETARATPPTRPRKLELRGSLAFDPNRLVNVSARFPGQIMEVATVDEPA